MKKLILLLLAVCSIQFTAMAQGQSDKQSELTKTQAITAKKNIQNSSLDKQLIAQFGEAYTLTATDVVAQLNKNIDDENATYELRKLSLVALYGNNAAEHANRIGR